MVRYDDSDEGGSSEDEELELEKAALASIARERAMAQEEEEEGDEGGAAAAALTKKKKEFIYNVEAIHERLEDISRVDSLPWEETLVCTSGKGGEDGEGEAELESVHNDLERELFFYNQALGAVEGSIQRFDGIKGFKWRRPTDYFAEMVKSDEHMKRVKDKLLYEKKVGEEQEERRKQREAKKYAKQVQAEKLKERAQAKNKQISSLKEWRKQRANSNYEGDGGDFSPQDFDFSGKKKQEGKQPAGQRIFGGRNKSKKREARDKKFGFGGRKKIQKQNDAKSSADDSGWTQGRYGGKFAGSAMAKTKKKKAASKKNRPGKARREQMRS